MTIFSLDFKLTVFDILFLLQISNRKYPKLKEVDDVLGGTAAWENVDSTAGILQQNLVRREP